MLSCIVQVSDMKKEVPIWEKSNLTLEEASAYFGIGRVLFICQEGAIMAIERRKDNKNRVLKEREYQRANGTFEYKWRDKSDVFGVEKWAEDYKRWSTCGINFDDKAENIL